MNLARFRRRLLAWYAANARDLPWRQTRDPYAIWLSEVMLQQTRVAAVIPYYERFLDLFPTVEILAAAPEQELLAAWAGLGYYSRARNLQGAARDIVVQGGFPRSYDSIAALPGIGAYTAAAVASIAFDLPHAAVDGNVLRVIARLDADDANIAAPVTRRRMAERAQQLLERREPGSWNQAMMELGATICLPRNPKCLICPVAADCEARAEGTASSLPTKVKKTARDVIRYSVAIVEKRGRVLLLQRPSTERRLAGFWELPRVDGLAGFEAGRRLGTVRHAITVNDFEIEVVAGEVGRAVLPCRWIRLDEAAQMPLTTVSRKALRLAGVAVTNRKGAVEKV